MLKFDLAQGENTMVSRLTMLFLLFQLAAIITTVSAERVTDQLLVFYNFQEGNGNIVNDISGNTPAYDLHIRDSDKVAWILGGGLSVYDPTIITAKYPPYTISANCKSTNEITIEVWIKPAYSGENSLSKILDFSSGLGKRNFTLAQKWDRYHVFLRSSTTGEYANIPSIEIQEQIGLKLTHIVYTRSRDSQVRAYLNGTEVGTSDSYIPGNFSTWNDSSFILSLANGLKDNTSWLGVYYLVAIYSKALTPEEIAQNYEAGEKYKQPQMVKKTDNSMRDRELRRDM